MKYGQQLHHESVPEWSLHNLDYDSLKHEIKVHTTRDQAATALAIPGHPDQALCDFEEALYAELDRQHSRLHLFVNSKADEISRRLDHVDRKLQRWICRCAAAPARDPAASYKRQRAFARYERDLLRCGQDICAVRRFAAAQVVAFRKILKKFRKWTGSSTLSARFTDSILSNPKSFTRRDFAPLHARYHDLLADLRASAPCLSTPVSPSSADLSVPEPESPGESAAPVFTNHLQSTAADAAADNNNNNNTTSCHKYWNEYDDGSDDGSPDMHTAGGGEENEYAIYVDPNAEREFPGLGYVRAMTTRPYEKAKQWFVERRKSTDNDNDNDADETRPLLPAPAPHPLPSSSSRLSSSPSSTTPTPTLKPAAPPPLATASTTTILDSSDAEASSSSSSSTSTISTTTAPLPQTGYMTYKALPSTSEQRHLARYRETMLRRGTATCLAASYAVFLVATVLSGKRRLRVEVDAGASLGVMASLLLACAGLGMMLVRKGRVGWVYRVGVWAGFVLGCLMNGVLLVVVLGSGG